ncbi:hypothetical protein ABIA25_001089 [Sinorhizobium fredii]
MPPAFPSAVPGRRRRAAHLSAVGVYRDDVLLHIAQNVAQPFDRVVEVAAQRVEPLFERLANGDREIAFGKLVERPAEGIHRGLDATNRLLALGSLALALLLHFVPARGGILFERALLHCRGPEQVHRPGHLTDFVAPFEGGDSRCEIARMDALHAVAQPEDTPAKRVSMEPDQRQHADHDQDTDNRLQQERVA